MHYPETSHGFDAHTHLDFPEFDEDRQAVCERARAAGVTEWIIAGAHPNDWERVRECAESIGGYPVLGIHPWHVNTLTDSEIQAAINRLEQECTPYGLGELGLDYLRAKTTSQRERQQRVFRSQLGIARRANVPLVLHTVRALHDLLPVLRTQGLPERGGMIHAWSGSVEQLKEALKLGLYISFSGLILRSPKVLQAVALVPMSRMLLETDCPDQPLHPNTRNEPMALPEIAAAVACVRDETPQTLLQQTRINAIRLFGVES